MIRKAILKSFDKSTYKASVQIVGSLSVWLDLVPVSTHIPWTDLVVGRPVAVLFMDPSNPSDAAVVGIWDGTPNDGRWLADFGAIVNLFFDSGDPWTLSHTGSGSSTFAMLNHTLQTGATINSIARTYTGTSLCGFYNGCRWASDISMDPLTAQTVWVGQFNGTAPTDTCAHIGFRVVNGLIYASSGDGANGTQTSTGYTAGSWETIWLAYEHCGASVKFYVQNILRATHTSNYPNPGVAYSRALNYITNTAAANKYLQVRRIHMMQARAY